METFSSAPTTVAVMVRTVPAQSVPPSLNHQYVMPQYSIATGLCSVALAVFALFALMRMAEFPGKKTRPRHSVELLKRQVTLERIFQTHYWSQDYRTQHASEDYRSMTINHQD